MGASLFYVSDAARLMAVAKLDTTSADDQGLFGITRSALASRVSDHDGVLFLDTVPAFSGDFMSANDCRNGAAPAWVHLTSIGQTRFREDDGCL
jgi:hypothetical protein